MEDNQKKKVLEMVLKENLLVNLLETGLALEKENAKGLMGLVQEKGTIMDLVEEKKKATGKHKIYEEEKES
jgi:hypothetical protein